MVPDSDGSCVPAVVGTTIHLDNVLLDSGAGATILNTALLAAILSSGTPCVFRKLTPQRLAPFTVTTIEVSDQITLDRLELITLAGPLILRHLSAWVVDDDSHDPRLIISRPVMERLGYSLPHLLRTARSVNAEWDLSHPVGPATRQSGVVDTQTITHEGPSDVTSLVPLALAEDTALELSSTGEDHCHVELPTQIQHDEDKMHLQRLHGLLQQYEDVFRLGFGSDPPVQVPPLEVRLHQGATPVCCSARRYPPAHQVFLDQHLQELTSAGLVYMNTQSRWASPPRIVSKSDGSYRMTVDMRAFNARTQTLQWPMPQLEVAMGLVVGSRYFFTPDSFRKLAIATWSPQPRAVYNHDTQGNVYPNSSVDGVSQDFWGSVVTQIPLEDMDLPLYQQRHQPLAFLSGRFVGASSRWPIPDKEAFAIVESCKRLEYILLRPNGFTIYTDHRNLAYLFNPLASDSGMQRHQADRLQRWAMVLSGYSYNIVHIPGESNVWADMLSRWHAQHDENKLIQAQPMKTANGGYSKELNQEANETKPNMLGTVNT
ncbi:hypothetical protein LEN26_002101 [Aphanomyces euteiches]|nr:hypothetical protein LEN26_002101 [Aphanomyces euteiches]